jgi:hypothetical protein
MFGGLSVEDSMAEILSRLLRLPPKGGLTVINLPACRGDRGRGGVVLCG